MPSSPSTLTRDELLDLLNVPVPTLYSWWAKGKEHIPPPCEVGGAKRQALFTRDEVFYISVFAHLVRAKRRKLQEAAIAGRYLAARPGAIDVVRSWPRPALEIYPRYGVAAFRPPKNLLERWLAEGKEQALAQRHGAPEEIRFRRDLHDVGSDQAFSELEGTKLNRGEFVTAIFREAKHHQRGEREPEPVLDTHSSVHAPPDVALDDRLLREAWAMWHIRDALDTNPFTLEFDGGEAPHYRVELTGLLTDIAHAFP